MNKINIKSALLFLLSMVFCLSGFTACTDTETTDSGSFAIYYPGMVDIGPSMVGVIRAPSYIGGAPSNFEITKTTLNGEIVKTGSFEIDPQTGTISIKDTEGIPVGHYKLSIKCVSGGNTHEFKDLVEVNMMKAVPEGISVDPSKLSADYGEVINLNGETPLPTSQVVTDGNHVSITKYEIAKSDFSKCFAISSTGQISIVRGSVGLEPGKYSLSLKLTTGASGEDEGIYENAIEVDITSKPLLLTYAPNSGKIEEESALSGNTTYKSNAPSLKGSKDELEYSIQKVTPATDNIVIDAQTGVITVKEKHGFIAGQQYVIDVNVKNIYDKEGVIFEGVFQLHAVNYIEPISNFTYANTASIQSVAFEVALASNFAGDEVNFELVNVSDILKNNLTLGIDGKISAMKGNTIPLGDHTISIKAINPKSDPLVPTITSFVLTVGKNPNYFTYVRYGNNLGLAPVENYASQYRIGLGGALSDVNPIPTTDATVALTYEIENVFQTGTSTINPTTGEISLTTLKPNQNGVVMVTAIAGKGTPSEVSVKVPVFFNFVGDPGMPKENQPDKILVEYTPFVLQVNPRTGGRSVVPSLKDVSDPAKLRMDYRRTFNYYNFFGTHKDGSPAKGGPFLGTLWENYFAGINKNPNYGSKDPVSYYSNSDNAAQALVYVDPTTFQVVVNPNKWIGDGEPASGVFSGQITYVTNGKESGVNNGGQLFPILIWFDKNF